VDLWLVMMWLDSSCEDCRCSNLSEALEFAEALRSDYQGRISIPRTLPFGPTISPAKNETSPNPHPTSRMCMPSENAAARKKPAVHSFKILACIVKRSCSLTEFPSTYGGGQLMYSFIVRKQQVFCPASSAAHIFSRYSRRFPLQMPYERGV
jgi:hypothetical protein